MKKRIASVNVQEEKGAITEEEWEQRIKKTLEA
jgi:hypothetical protein